MSGSLLPNITRASLTQPLFAPFGSGGGGGSGQSTFTVSTLTVSDLLIPGAVNINSGTSQFSTITANSIQAGGGGVRMNNTTLVWNTSGSAGTYWDAGNSVLNTVVPDNSAYYMGTISNPYALFTQVSSVTTNVLFVSPAVSTQSLLVSSVNGATYPPQGSGTVSTLGFSAANFPGGNGTAPTGGTPIGVTDSFAVDPTHRYRLSYEAAYNSVDPNSYTTVYMSGTSPVFYLTTVNNQMAIPASNDARASVGGIFVPNSSPCQLVAATSSGVAGTGIQFNTVAGVVLEDLGKI